MFKYVVALYLMAYCISANPLSTSCPDLKVVQNFDLVRYMGKWYVQANYFCIFQVDTKCTTAEYTLRDDGKINVVNRAINKLSGEVETSVGIGRNVSPTGEAKGIVNYPPNQREEPYWVLSTDYEKYSLVWSCMEKGSTTQNFAWLMTREPKPSKSAMDNIEQAIKDSGIDGSFFLPFLPVSQDNCTYT